VGEALQVLPAVDVSKGRAVQLAQGDPGSARDFGDPVEAALGWQAAGAKWMHLVDLDAAFGRGSNSEVLSQVVATVAIEVEVSGGIHDDAGLRAALATQCNRVILSAVALETPDWLAATIARHGDRVAVALDVRGTTLAPRGSIRGGGELHDVLAWLDGAGCARYVITDVSRDGMLEGPNLALLRDACARTPARVIASGGVSTLDDVAALARLVPLGVEGAIVGTALYTGALDLAAALALVAGAAPETPG
jgi:1-(5-phosphoribosyl)-5-[(5-phosphoribosylamino)methylideneamino] imidazole-4-carboxamide isomerase/N-(5'phosphoribosyl)anthranilate isomerase